MEQEVENLLLSSSGEERQLLISKVKKSLDGESALKELRALRATLLGAIEHSDGDIGALGLTLWARMLRFGGTEEEVEETERRGVLGRACAALRFEETASSEAGEALIAAVAKRGGDKALRSGGVVAFWDELSGAESAVERQRALSCAVATVREAGSAEGEVAVKDMLARMLRDVQEDPLEALVVLETVRQLAADERTARVVADCAREVVRLASGAAQLDMVRSDALRSIGTLGAAGQLGDSEWVRVVQAALEGDGDGAAEAARLAFGGVADIAPAPLRQAFVAHALTDARPDVRHAWLDVAAVVAARGPSSAFAPLEPHALRLATVELSRPIPEGRLCAWGLLAALSSQPFGVAAILRSTALVSAILSRGHEPTHACTLRRFAVAEQLLLHASSTGLADGSAGEGASTFHQALHDVQSLGPMRYTPDDVSIATKSS